MYLYKAFQHFFHRQQNESELIDEKYKKYPLPHYTECPVTINFHYSHRPLIQDLNICNDLMVDQLLF